VDSKFELDFGNTQFRIAETPRNQIPRNHRISAKPILGGSHHEYRLERIAA
jgi:hypothetical protein